MLHEDSNVQLHAGQDTNRQSDPAAGSNLDELQRDVSRKSEFVSQGRHWHEHAAASIDLPGHWEVVEVKNHCPFTQVRQLVPTAAIARSKPSQQTCGSVLLNVQESNKGRKRWRVRDTGPRESVPLQYVGQLQLEMLCTGLQSALLVSRSSSKGTHVFRMARSDSYCKCVLLHASRFKSQYTSGCAAQTVPNNFFSSWKTHHKLCRMTSALRNSATLLCHLPPDCCLGQSQPMFL